MNLRYIIAYKLKRKNARRREYSRFMAVDENDARTQFESYMKYRLDPFHENKMIWELLTGDWKHICFWCEYCGRETSEECVTCDNFTKMKGEGNG